MRRDVSLSAIVVLALVAAFAGNASGRGMPAQRSPEQVELIARKTRALGLGATVKIELPDGRRIQGVLLEIEATTIRIAPRLKDGRAPMTVAIADIQRISKARQGTHPAVWVAVGIGVAILVPLALCAAAA